MAQCENCKKLEKELKDLEKFFAALANDIYLTAAAAANEIEAGNVPKGRYEFLLAQHETANEILEKMNKPTAGLNRKSQAGLFSGFFRGLS